MMPFLLIILGGLMVLSIASLFRKDDKEEHFWKWFASHSKDYYNYPLKKQEALFDRLSSELSKVNKDLTFEFGPISNDGRKELIISADGIYSSFPSVISLVKKAPHLEKWKIVAFRQRGTGYEVQLGEVKLSEKDVFFKYRKNGEKIDIWLYIKGYRKQSDYDQAMYIILDSVLGEYDVETQIGGIERYEFDENSKEKNLLPILDLAKIVDENKKAN